MAAKTTTRKTGTAKSASNITLTRPRTPEAATSRKVEGTVPSSVFPARHAGPRFGGMGAVSDDI